MVLSTAAIQDVITENVLAVCHYSYIVRIEKLLQEKTRLRLTRFFLLVEFS